MHTLLLKGEFLLRKWSCSDPHVLESMHSDWFEELWHLSYFISFWSIHQTLGTEWNTSCDHFRVHVIELPPIESMTKISLVSDVMKILDAFGWYSPTIIVKAKIILQMLWIEGVGWDDCVPNATLEEWSKWRRVLPLLSTHHTARYYYPKDAVLIFPPNCMVSQMPPKRPTRVSFISKWKTVTVWFTSHSLHLRYYQAIYNSQARAILALLLSHCKELIDLS